MFRKVAATEISEKFKRNLKNKIGEIEAESIYKKGSEIIDKIFNFFTKEEKRKFLMVGKIQSGKTVNFISIIVNAFVKENINLFIIFTSYDNLLRNQTTKSINDWINHDGSCENHLRIKDNKDLKNLDFIKNLIDDIDRGKLNIIVLLKNDVKKIKEKIFENDYLSQKKFLIIDDEGDLGSMTNNEKKDSKTLSEFTEFMKKTSNSFFLSVTATPQVHLFFNKEKFMKPDYHFTIDPGEGYTGLEYFQKNKEKFFFELNEQDDNNWYKSKEFKKSLLLYLITAAKLFHEKILDSSSHSNMLIHISRKNIEHEKYDEKVKEIINNYRNIFDKNVNDISYKNFINEIQDVINEFKINIEINDCNEYLDYLKCILGFCDVKVINQSKNKNITNNQNQCTINIGSALVERGITFDNLLTTFFTNRPKGIATIDTLLQRARWFGYRSKILEYIKIFSTHQIIEDFDKIYENDQKVWKTLKQTEKEGTEFKDIKWPKINSNDLKETRKTPIIRYNCIHNIYYQDDINLLSNYVESMKKIIDKLSKSKNFFLASNISNSGYRFRYLELENFNIFYEYLSKEKFQKIVNIDKNVLDFIEKRKNYKTKIVLLENVNEHRNDWDKILYRERKCICQNGKYKIDQLFQGSSEDKQIYIGDRYFNEINNESETIFIQVHCVKPKIENEIFIYPIAIFLPKKIQDEFKDY